MYIRAKHYCREFYPRNPDSIWFKYETRVGPVSLEFRKWTDDDVSGGIPAISGIIESHLSSSTPDDVERYFRGFADGRFPSGPQPSEVGDFVQDVASTITDYVKRTVDTAAWRMDRRGLIASNVLHFQWSLDGTEWHQLPGELQIGGAFAVPISFGLSDAAREEIEDVVAAGGQRPLARVLAAEARGLSPRASLVMAITAAEFGVKEFLAEAVPDSEWLIFNVPSPPVPTILEQYLPKFVPPEIGLSLNKKFTDALRGDFNRRNNVVHGRAATEPPDREDVAAVIARVDHLLSFLDICSGHDWARQDLIEEYVGPAPLPQKA